VAQLDIFRLKKSVREFHQDMPLLHKFSFCRAQTHKYFKQILGSKEEYQLSALGKCLQKTLVKLFPKQFYNVYVLIAET
jgi:hypothetical protein